MAAPIALRSDYDGPVLHRLAKALDNAHRTRRLLALTVICDGGLRGATAVVGGVELQIVRDWMLRFNAEGPDGLIDRKAPGAVPKLDNAQRPALAAIVDSGSILSVHGAVRGRLEGLARWLFEEFGVVVRETTISRELQALGVRRLSARPRHRAHNGFVIEHFNDLPDRAGGDPGALCRRCRDGGLVPGRGPHRLEERHHPPLGAARRAAAPAP